MSKILTILQEIFRDVFDNPTLVIASGTSCENLEDWDSVAQVKLVLAIEECFHFQFTENEVSTIRDVGGFIRLIERSGFWDVIEENVVAKAQKTPSPVDSVDHESFFKSAQNFFAAGSETEAADALRRAFALFPPYSFYVRSEKTVEKLAANPAWQPRRAAKVALVGSSTTALLAPVLRAAAFAGGVKLALYEGLYGNYRQEILDPASGLYAFAPDFVVILVNHFDIAAQGAEAFVAELLGLWQTLLARHGCRIVQIAPPEFAPAISAGLPPPVSCVDAGEIAREVGPDFFSDAEWNHAKQYPASAALPRLADAIAAQLRASLGLSAKVLVLDLDNTLWGGVVGEDGAAGIQIGQGNAEAEAYLAIQTYAKELAARGIVLAACSKNNTADAEAPFKERDMPLKLADFAAFCANWEDKPANLRAIAKKLSLGLDSFVFLDDNPLERELVRRELPEVTVPEFSGGPVGMLAALKRGRYFESAATTAEDLRRGEFYRDNVAREELKTSSASLEDFLKGLEMRAEAGPVHDATLERVTQLVNKTNQFNLTTRRRTIEEVRAIAISPDWWCRWFRLSDKFGDQGLIGVVFAEKGAEWRVDTWLMSCRVLGRRMEDFMLYSLLSAAKSEGATRVIGEFIPTAKNALVKDFYAKSGFVAIKGAEGKFVYDLSQKTPAPCTFIRAEES